MEMVFSFDLNWTISTPRLRAEGMKAEVIKRAPPRVARHKMNLVSGGVLVTEYRLTDY